MRTGSKFPPTAEPGSCGATSVAPQVPRRNVVAASMGIVISLDERRGVREHAAAAPAHRPRVCFHFDATSPWTYLAAERVERRLSALRWVPVAPAARHAASRAAVEHRARELAMPLVWPARGP